MSEALDAADTDAAVLHRIAAKLPYMPAALRQVGELVLHDPEAARLMSITPPAIAADAAESTVRRFVRRTRPSSLR